MSYNIPYQSEIVLTTQEEETLRVLSGLQNIFTAMSATITLFGTIAMGALVVSGLLEIGKQYNYA